MTSPAPLPCVIAGLKDSAVAAESAARVEQAFLEILRRRRPDLHWEIVRDQPEREAA